MAEPWIAVAADIRRNRKMTALPSDQARYGFIVALCEAKLLRAAGTFTPGQWAEVMGRHARYLTDYVRVGLIHVAPDSCGQARCRKGRTERDEGTLVVHDWHVYQREHAARQADYRARSDGKSDAGSDAPSDVVSDAKSDTHSRALSLSHVERDSDGGVDGGGSGGNHALSALAEEVTGQPYALQNLHSRLGEMAVHQLQAKGMDAVAEAWRTVARAAGPSPTIRQIVLGADDVLFPVPRLGRPMSEQDEIDRLVAETNRELAEQKARQPHG